MKATVKLDFVGEVEWDDIDEQEFDDELSRPENILMLARDGLFNGTFDLIDWNVTEGDENPGV